MEISGRPPLPHKVNTNRQVPFDEDTCRYGPVSVSPVSAIQYKEAGKRGSGKGGEIYDELGCSIERILNIMASGAM